MRFAEGATEAEVEYVGVAAQALRASGAAALDSLGWWDLLAELHDPDLRMAAFALFRAQGAELASSAALGGLLAQPYLDGSDLAPGAVIAAVRRASVRGEPQYVVVGDPGGRDILVDRPGRGVAIVGADQLQLRPIELPGRMVLHQVTGDWSGLPASIEEEGVAAGRARSQVLGRVALAVEIIGAAEGAVGLAIDHAIDREQFGQPIARFQAVRHLLAWARTECTAASNVIREAVTLDSAAPPRFDEVVKAIAGRNGRRACEGALQVLGGIGFTAEHTHHHLHSRVLTLDGLLGTSSELTAGLGEWLRTERVDPRFTSAVLAGT